MMAAGPITGLFGGIANAISESEEQARVVAAKRQIDQEVKQYGVNLVNNQVAQNYLNQTKLAGLQNTQNMLTGRSSMGGEGLMSAYSTQNSQNPSTSGLKI